MAVPVKMFDGEGTGGIDFAAGAAEPIAGCPGGSDAVVAAGAATVACVCAAGAATSLFCLQANNARTAMRRMMVRFTMSVLLLSLNTLSHAEETAFRGCRHRAMCHSSREESIAARAAAAGR